MPVALLRELIEQHGLDLSTVIRRVAKAEGGSLVEGVRGASEHPLFRRLTGDGRVTLRNADRIVTLGLGDPTLWHTVPELAAVYEDV